MFLVNWSIFNSKYQYEISDHKYARVEIKVVLAIYALKYYQ